MCAICINRNVLGNSPDIYEGSYKDIFSVINFNFSVFSKGKSKKGAGRPKTPVQALFKALILKNLAFSSSFRTIEAIFIQNPELKEILGFDKKDLPSDSALDRLFAKLKLKEIQAIHNQLLQELRALGYAQGRIIALDSTPIKSYYKPPTKKGAMGKDPDARWGIAKCKNGWYYGYKAQVVVDAETYLPLHAIVTPANVSDQRMVKPFIKPLKQLGYHPERALLDAGYDNEANHFSLREELGCISLICPNKRRSKKAPAVSELCRRLSPKYQ